MDEVTVLGVHLMDALNSSGEPLLYSMKEPKSAVGEAVRTRNIALLRCYDRSFRSGRGIVGAHFMYPELSERGYERIEDFVVPWRIDLRKDLLRVMQNLPGTTGEHGLSKESVDCIVMAYTAETEYEAQLIASLISERHITHPDKLSEMAALVTQHHGAIADGTL